MCAIVSGPFPTLSERVFQAAAVQQLSSRERSYPRILSGRPV